jgi:hypothetical protein
VLPHLNRDPAPYGRISHHFESQAAQMRSFIASVMVIALVLIGQQWVVKTTTAAPPAPLSVSLLD